MSRKWWRVVVAMSSLVGGLAGAASAVPVVQPLVARDTRLEVTSTRGLESGSWVLVEPGGVGAWWARELLQIQVADERHLELLRPLVGVARAGDAQVSLVSVAREAEGSAPEWLDSPRPHDRVGGGGELPVEGEAPRGTQVLVFMDGVEAARWESDVSGRFAGTVEMPRTAGEHQVQVVRELEGTWTVHSEPVTVVSLAAPPPPVVNEPLNGSFTNNPRPLFSGTGQGNTRVTVTIAGVEVGSTDVDPFGNWSLTLASPLAEGFHSANVTARFPGDTPSEPTVVGLTVDVTPPNTEFTDTPPARTTQTTGQFIFQTGEFASRYECSLDNSAFEACSRPYVFNNPLADGQHVFAVRGIDRAGNVEVEPSRYEWLIDTTPPTLVFISSPPVQSNVTSSSFTVQANEEVQNYQCTLDGMALAATDCGATTTVSLLAEGPHTLVVRASDLVGLSQEISYQWNVDLMPPGKPVLVQPAAGALLGTSTPAISGTAEAGATVKVIIGGSERCAATVDASGNWTCTPTAPLTTNPSYALTLQVQDAAGNVNDQFTPITFAVDVDAPDTFIDVPDTFTSDAQGLVARSESPVFGFRSTEEGVTYECRVNDVPASCEELSTGRRQFTPGRYTLQVLARDRVGNADATPATQSWTFTPYRASGGGLTGCSASGAAPLLPLVPLLAFLKRRRSRAPRQTARLGTLVASLVALLVAPARAQGVNLQQYTPAPGSRDMLGVSSPEVTPSGRFHAGVSVNYARNPLVLRTASDDAFAQSIVEGQLTADVVGSYTFFDRLELGLAIPVTTQWGPAPGNLGVFIPENATGTGLGNLRVVPKFLFFSGEALSLGLAGVVSLPTATSSQGFLGSNGWGFQPMLLGQWAAGKQFRVLANAGVRLQSERRIELLDLTVGNELTYAVGAHWSQGPAGLFVQGSLEGAAALGGQRSSTVPLELLVAVGHTFENGMSLRFGGGPGLTSGYGTPNFRFFGGIDGLFGSSGNEVTPPTRVCTGLPDKDDDQDEILNQVDQCPYVHGVRDARGCPKEAAAEVLAKALADERSDRDEDGVPNYVDACPAVAGKEARGCPDQDKDKVVDDVDACPSEGETLNDILDKDGCSEKPSAPIAVKLSFPEKGFEPDADSVAGLQNVVNAVKALPDDTRLAAVQAVFPQGKTKLMSQRIESVSRQLAANLQGLPLSEVRKKAAITSSGGKQAFTAEFIIWTTSAKAREMSPRSPPKCARQGIAARLLWADDGKVTAGADNKALANQEEVCVGDSVKTGKESGAVLVLSDGDVLRLAPESQVTLRNSSEVQLKGRAELRNHPDKALAGPRIPVPDCVGPVTRPSSLSWSRVNEARGYLVQVSSSATFDSNVRFVSTDAEHTEVQLAPLQLPAGETWYWRVLPVNDKGFTGEASKTYGFEVGAAAVSQSPKS